MVGSRPWPMRVAPLLLAACAAASARGSELLRVAREPGNPDGVVLSWIGPGPQFDLFRSPDPRLVGDPPTGLGDATSPWTDASPPAEPLACYEVASACRVTGPDACNGLDDDCNGQVDDGIDLQNDPLNCGSCDHVCALPHATARCEAGTCQVLQCDATWGDLDGIPDNGCEFRCEASGSDAPDDAFQDRDCDGVDGNAAGAVFVASDVGDDANPGTRPSPLRTIQAGIELAAATARDVYVSKGLYPESLVLRSGVDVHGGYDQADAWARAADHLTVIQGGARAVSADAVVAATLDLFIVQSDDATVPGGSSDAIWARGSTGIVLANLQLQVGSGAAGAAGAAGRRGTDGRRGYAGSPGCERSSALLCGFCGAPPPGMRGTSGCLGSGGDGGGAGLGPANGAYGASGSGGAPGGTPGSPGAGCHAGGDGGAGRDGISGFDGRPGDAGGEIGAFDASGYVPGVAESGGFGSDGMGGGGGGGGGGGTFACDSFGSSGGGGGAGGCGGGGGGGGRGGGGSFGIFLIDTAVTVRATTVLTGRGGDGGAGGAPGSGGAGGDGGAGGPYGGSDEQDDGSCGGAGGAGGRAGDGGAGGGGGGGPAIGLYLGGSSSVAGLPALAISPGIPGVGGTSAGNAGADGVAANVYP